MTESLIGAQALQKGTEAARFIDGMLSGAGPEHNRLATAIPARFWSACKVDNAEGEEGGEVIRVRGAVLLNANKGLKPRIQNNFSADSPKTGIEPKLEKILEQSTSRPWNKIAETILQDGFWLPMAILAGTFIAAAGFTMTGLGLMVIMKLGKGLLAYANPSTVVENLTLLLLLLFLLEIPIASLTAGIGRRFENRLRIDFLSKLPRLGDRYFYSRLVSDMVQRAHELRQLRTLPTVVVSFFRAGFEFVLTAAALSFFLPHYTPQICLMAATTCALSYLSYPLLREQDMRVRTLESTLSRYYLDALQGLVPIRTHCAEKSVRQEHEGTVVDWNRSTLGFYRTAIVINSVASFVNILFVIWMVFRFITDGGEQGLILLLLYWALRLPQLGSELAVIVGQQYPALRNLTARLMETIDAEEEWYGTAEKQAAPATKAGAGVTIRMSTVSVTVGSQDILRNIDLDISAGEHIAIVGPSGSGKSSLVGTLLGWHTPVAGKVLIDSRKLVHSTLVTLREETAWVDPSVQLRNESLNENIVYGSNQNTVNRGCITAAGLQKIIAGLPDGAAGRLGEGGGLVSGGEGQRVRLARALQRNNVRLAILDEPFRGLDRESRQELLVTARKAWSKATLLYISHDLSESLQFDRVLVVEDGQIREDGQPDILSKDSTSRYHALLQAETRVQDTFLSGVPWRYLHFSHGQIQESSSRTAAK